MIAGSKHEHRLNTLPWPMEGWGSASPSHNSWGPTGALWGWGPCSGQHDEPHAASIRRQTTWSSKRVTEPFFSPFLSWLSLVWYTTEVLFHPLPTPCSWGAKAQQGSEHCPASAIICLKPPKKGAGISLPGDQPHQAPFSPATAFPIISSGSGWEESRSIRFMVPSFLMNH